MQADFPVDSIAWRSDFSFYSPTLRLMRCGLAEGPEAPSAMLCLSLMLSPHREKMTPYKPRREASEDTNTADAVNWDF